MNYRHAFHAGNHADVLKHLILVFCLNALKHKPAPFAVLDTHAGPGLYDLASAEARRSPEWRGGIGKLFWDWSDAPPLVADYVAAVRAANPDGALALYPGSPVLVRAALRERDRLAACELHPDDAAALKARFAKDAQAQVHQRDGWEALRALLPPPERRGLVLIDPPYESPSELDDAVAGVAAALKRFGHGVFLWWRPLKDQSALARADAELLNYGVRNWLRADLSIDAPEPNERLTGSSVFLINPPFGLEPALRQALPALASRLSVGSGDWRLVSM